MTDDFSCDEYCGVSRRELFKRAGLIGMAGVVTSMFGDVLTSTVYGATNDNVLIVLSLRGGADGLSMLVPHAETNYYAKRPNTAVNKAELLHADEKFGLHPKFKALDPLWNSGKMAAIHAVGLPMPNRSHFEAMELVEDADPGSADRIGWLNRMIGHFAGESVFTGVQLGSTIMPTSLIGPEQAVSTTDFASLSAPTGRDLAALTMQYESTNAVIGTAGQDALALGSKAASIATKEKAGPANGATYPSGSLSSALKSTAALIRSGIGVKAVAVDYGGWDHHVDLRWRVANNIESMSKSLAAFFVDLGPKADKVTVVTLSEFGRRLEQNGAAGVDHGYGNVVFAFGAGVKGGYYSEWPGLASSQLTDGDLKMTTDYRSVLAEVLEARFPEVAVSSVFPGISRNNHQFMTSI